MSRRGAGPVDGGRPSDRLTVAARFCGPPDSANGGYVAGRLAALVHLADEPAAVTVTLRRPPPLARALEVRPADDGVTLHDGDLLLAEAARAEPDALAAGPPLPSLSYEDVLALPEPPEAHPYPTCYGCSVARTDGLGASAPRLLPTAATGEAAGVATAWQPAPDQTDAVFAWVALDCPGIFALRQPERGWLLGRFTARVLEPPAMHGRYTVTAHVLERAERTARTLTVLRDETGAEAARAVGTWVATAPATAGAPGT